MKNDKVVNDEKLLKIGLGLGKGDLRVEGNFQMGWHRRCNKKYVRNTSSDPEAEPLVPMVPLGPAVQEADDAE